MKKITLLFILFSAFSFSQMTLKKLDGTPINNNDVFTFTSLKDPQNYLGLKIYNSSPNNINVKAKCISITNGNGIGTQLCFGGVCVSDISAGNTYPSNAAVIPANGSNENNDHFLSTTAGTNPGNNLEFVFKFFQINSFGAEIGNSVTFTYRYSPVLATNSLNNVMDIGVKLKSNLVTNQLDLEVSRPATCQIYDLNGKLLNPLNLVTGNQTIDVSYLKSGFYFLSVRDEENLQSTVKFLKN